MEVIITADADAAGVYVADIIERLVRETPTAHLGLATGSSPLSVYRELIRRHRTSGLSFDRVTAFLLDDYLGLPAGHPQGYRTFLERELTDAVGITADRLHGPDVTAPDVAQACEDYDARVTRSGIDLQLLGVGGDGHIGFNEPGSSLASRTRIKTLTRETRRDNARFFDAPDDVPRHVVTQGIGTILQARRLVLLAFGTAKAAAIARTVEGPVSARYPASALQLHRRVTVVIDEAAASQLELTEYYRDAFEHKPDWQRP